MRWSARAIRSLPVLLLLWSSSAPAAPPPVPSPCFTKLFNGPALKGVELDWVPSLGTFGYRVYRDGILIAEVGPGVLLWLDEEFPVRGDTQYCVESFNADGPSARCCANASPTLSDTAVVAGPDWYQDTFPWDETPGLPGAAAFATKSAKVASGRNTAPPTNTTLRFDVPRPYAVLHAPPPVTRVDLVFRVKPGPGNYDVVGAPASGLIPFPDVPRPGAVIAPGDVSFWSYYIAYNGDYGTGSPGTNGVPHPGGAIPWAQRWDPNTWNSAQCALLPGSGGDYITNYAVSPTMQIIPDFLLTAGAHVEYFFRAQWEGRVITVPDTNRVLQIDGERSIDGHRWAEFSVLPDLWKSADYGGPGLAQTLVIDLCNGHGAERIWTGTADSTGATAPSQFGANNGWHAIGGGADVDAAASNRQQDDVTPGFTSMHIGQPGTTWDLFNVQGPDDGVNGYAGSIGSRLAPRPGPGPLFGLESRQGPTQEMLRAYYRLILIFTGDRHTRILGPLINRGQDDITILDDFLTNAAGTPRPRGIFVEGEGFAECEGDPTIPVVHPAFMNDRLATIFRDRDYRSLSGNTDQSARLWPIPSGDFEEFRLNGDPDVLMRNPAIGESRDAAYWENVGLDGPYVASVYKPSTAGRPWVAMVNGWNMARQFRSYSRLGYIDKILDELFSGVTQVTTPGRPLSVPQQHPPSVGLSVLENPVCGRPARIRFELPDPCLVGIDILDLAGRKISSLVNRRYDAGRWEVTWAGTDAAGHRVGPGVYFVRMLRGGRSAGATRMVILR